MDAEAGQTPFDQRLFLIFMVTFAAMLLFEFSAQFLYPYPPDWRSNIITSLFTSGLAVCYRLLPLKRITPERTAACRAGEEPRRGGRTPGKRGEVSGW